MDKRPDLDKNLDSSVFRSFYYLKEELVDFCRKNKLPTAGSKIELTEKIAYYLDTNEILSIDSKTKPNQKIDQIYDLAEIEANFICSEKHRAYFKEKIGKTFSFNVTFQKWLKSNAGKTYDDAVEVYYHILEDKKINKTKIDKQFEYNTYIRDFFSDNSGKCLEEAIKCWKYKKSLAGHNKYEKEDLIALNLND